MKLTTLCIIIDYKKKKVLLAMKKRGFGAGKWNAAGGKVMPGELIIDTAIRETKEEIGLNVSNLLPIGRVRFYFPEESCANDHDVRFFLAQSWTGKLTETDEMLPRWFPFDQIPYDKMWQDDRYWLPKVLEGKRVSGKIYFDQDGNIIENNLRYIKPTIQWI